MPRSFRSGRRLGIASGVRDGGEAIEQPKRLQEPQHHSNDNDRVQDGLDGSLHWDVAVDQPEQNPNDNEDKYYVQ